MGADSYVSHIFVITSQPSSEDLSMQYCCIGQHTHTHTFPTGVSRQLKYWTLPPFIKNPFYFHEQERLQTEQFARNDETDDITFGRHSQLGYSSPFHSFQHLWAIPKRQGKQPFQLQNGPDKSSERWFIRRGTHSQLILGKSWPQVWSEFLTI